MEKRQAKAIINKTGSGGINIRIPLPREWANKLGINVEDKNISIEFNGNEIIIKKL